MNRRGLSNTVCRPRVPSTRKHLARANMPGTALEAPRHRFVRMPVGQMPVGQMPEAKGSRSPNGAFSEAIYHSR